ncbi:RNA polymerase beta subunit rpoC1 (apicoplast) [Theileria orientalis]|uniref:DNA-directed RNA polymerase n=1 Tax=Theileria orientalis TaxID=68886 RepID=A0A976XJT0_THEOR|nr:RNA polymerase beta subunit rpoC1 [Theileria orientalis]
MLSYKNINIDILTPKELSDLIIRKYNGNYIIGIVTKSSGLLHKNKRFRPGGIFCEEIFGLLYTCYRYKCKFIPVFNESPILNRICPGCDKFMTFNFKRKYRFASVFLNFPIINNFYFNSFIKFFKAFKTLRVNYFKNNNSFKINYKKFYNNIFVNSVVLENKFFNLINSIYKITKYVELFKKKLTFLKKKKSSTETKFDKFSKILNDLTFVKKLFITLFPILPAGLRNYSFDNRRVTYNSKLNYLYSGLITLNNMLINEKRYVYNLKVILCLHFIIEVILNFYKSKDVFNFNNDLYNKLYGKYGVFRQNLLGFRVDYSGRASIIPYPSLPIETVGVPFNMVYHRVRREYEKGEVNDNEFYESSFYKHRIYDKFEFFEEFLYEYPVIVNRAPTLHKMNVQTLSPMLVEGESVQFNPLLCAGYNADFDGDQMGIFPILKNYAKEESLYMLGPLVNLHSPTTKNNVFNLTQGMLAGCYSLFNYNYLKLINSYISNNYTDVIEYFNRSILVDSPVLLRSYNFFYYSTCGRLLLNYNFNKK